MNYDSNYRTLSIILISKLSGLTSSTIGCPANLKKMSYKEDDSSQKFEISKKRLEHLWNKIEPDIWVARILYVELNI